jgi:hypothetical protein
MKRHGDRACHWVESTESDSNPAKNSFFRPSDFFFSNKKAVSLFFFSLSLFRFIQTIQTIMSMSIAPPPITQSHRISRKLTVCAESKEINVRPIVKGKTE